MILKYGTEANENALGAAHLAKGKAVLKLCGPTAPPRPARRSVLAKLAGCECRSCALRRLGGLSGQEALEVSPIGRCCVSSSVFY